MCFFSSTDKRAKKGLEPLISEFWAYREWLKKIRRGKVADVAVPYICFSLQAMPDHLSRAQTFYQTYNPIASRALYSST